MTTAKAQQFAIDVSWAFISSIIVIPVGFILRIILARWLGASELGLYQMAITIYSISIMVSYFGIPSSIIKFAAEFKDDKNNLDQFVTTSIICTVLLGSLVGLLIFSLSSFISRIFHMPDLTDLLKILAFAFPFIATFQTSNGLLNGLRLMRRYSSMIIAQSLMMIIFTIALVFMGFGLKGAVCGLLLSVIAACMISLAAIKPLFRFDITGLLEKMRTLLRYGGLLLGSDVMNIIACNSDIILIGYFLTESDVGFYSVAITLSMILSFIPAAIQRITYPATSEFFGAKNTHELYIMLDKCMKYTALVIIPLGMIIGLFSLPIIKILFGEKYLPAVLPLNILLIGRVTSGSINSPIGSLYTSLGRPEVSFFLDSFNSLTSIVLMLFLIPYMGIKGAAISITTAMLLNTLLFTYLMPRFVKFRIDTKWYLSIALLSISSISLITAASTYFNRYIVGIVVLIMFLAGLFRFFLTHNDMLFLKSYAVTVRRRFLGA